MSGADGSFDIVVIGSGVGGLTAGALAARSGKKVLVLEKNRTRGGAAGVYRVGDLAIESSLHEMDGLDAGDPKLPIFRRLDVEQGVRFVGVKDLWQVRSPVLGEPFVMPEGLTAGLEASVRRFPHHRIALEQYFARIGEIREMSALAVRHHRDPRWHHRGALERYFTLIGELREVMSLASRRHGNLRSWVFDGGLDLLRQGGLSLGTVLDALFGDDEGVKLALCANMIYYTDHPDHMWFPRWASAQASYHIGGGHYPVGGSQQLSDYLASCIEDAGGEVVTGRRVTRIVVTGGRVAGVEHASTAGGDPSPRLESAPLVFGNAAPHALAEMLDGEARTAFMARYAKRPVSLSLWTISCGFDRKLSELGVEHYSTAVFPRPLRDTANGTSLPGRSFDGTVSHYIFVDYSAVETGLTEGPPYLGTVVGLDHVDNWKGLSRSEYRLRRERWMDAVINSLDAEFPALSGALVQRTMTTATGASAYLGTPDGAIYGFAPKRRAQIIDPKTPIEGLWLTSAFAGLGGYSGAIIGSGVAAASALQESWRDWAEQ